MNIYNSSQAQASSDYPQSIVITNVDTQDIIIRNGLQISGLTKGGILIGENDNNDVGELVLGPNNYLLASDGNLPIWRNNININEIQTASLKIGGIQQGDILVGQADSFFGRLPRGVVDTVLFSDGTNLGWLPRSAGNSFFSAVGPFTIPLSNQNIINTAGLDLFAGKRYKLTVSANINSTGDTAFELFLVGSSIAAFTYVFGTDMARTIIYTSPLTGVINIRLTGFSSVNNSFLNNFLITAEEF